MAGGLIRHLGFRASGLRQMMYELRTASTQLQLDSRYNRDIKSPSYAVAGGRSTQCMSSAMGGPLHCGVHPRGLLATSESMFKRQKT